MSGASSPEAADASANISTLGLADYLLSVAVGAPALLLYVRTLAPGVLGGDSGEFQFAAYLGGFAHPTGYPLYLLLGYLWTHLLQVGSPAYRMNLFSALWGGAAVALTFLLADQMIRLAAPATVRRWAVRLAALLSATIFAVTPTFWSQAVVAEVYTLHATLVAAILLGLVVWKARESAPGRYRLLYLSAFLFGLGLAHHRSTLLLLPAIALFVLQSREWRGHEWSGSLRRRFAGAARAFPLVLVPVLLYALIPLRAGSAPYADVAVSPDQVIQLYRPTAGWLLQHVTGSAFGGALRSPSAALQGAIGSAGWMVEELTWTGVALAVVGVIWLLRRERTLLTLTGVAFLTFGVFNLFYGIGDIRVFYIPLFLIASLWVGLGVASIAATLLVAPSPARVMTAGLACLLAFALPASLLARNLPAVDRSGDRTAETFWRSLLAGSVPAGAILVSNDRDEMMPLWYLQYVEGLRPDITGLFPLIDPAPQWGNVGQVIDSSRNSGRPVYLIKEMPGLSVKSRLTPEDGLVRVDGPAVTRPPQNARTTTFGDVLRLTGYDLDPGLANPGAPVSIALYWQPLREVFADLTTFVHVVNADGAVVGRSDHRPGGDYYPTGLWRPGELLRDVHTLTLATELGPPPYALEVGAYRLSGAAPEITHLGSPQRVGLVGRARPSDAVPADLAGDPGYVLDDQIALVAGRIDSEEDRLDLDLYWQALRIPDRDYTVFAHVLDQAGNIVAQQDQQPTGGETPTSTWPAGQVVRDPVTIPLPLNLEPQIYRVIVGMYDALTGQRLPVASQDGGQVGDAIPLGEFAWPAGPP